MSSRSFDAFGHTVPSPGRHWKDAAALGLRAHALSDRLSLLTQDIERDLWELRNELAGLALELSSYAHEEGEPAHVQLSSVARQLHSKALQIDRGGPLGRAQDLQELASLAHEMFRGRGPSPQCSVAEALRTAIPIAQGQKIAPLLIQDICDEPVSLDLADLVGALVQLLLWLGRAPASPAALHIKTQAIDLWIAVTLQRRTRVGLPQARPEPLSLDLADEHLVTALIPLSAAGARLCFREIQAQRISLQLLLPRRSR